MCDRVTQVQDQINQVAEHMCNAVGMLQQTALPSVLPGRLELLSTPAKGEASNFSAKDLPFLFASLITKSIKEMDLLINLLPSEPGAKENMDDVIKRLDRENRESVTILQQSIGLSELFLAQIQKAINDIAECEMEIDRRKV
ncbi:mediator of RNA polymerase II transcription subunit 21-like [Paramacrobiotus metropolitanus]|uniref:mediator of RNA polymerase II transcription subunit 21-like n=1 Tax=Paramacrobiotus metropolitanus TaxID=2943436 RepID=UPI002445D7B7|nr:mediator of RNA polymerase II transcription subunit 21-like [Paramacrobiotus metropolitanus]XP_055327522.1 mediator of RNA polymerase II transcription subunit 21-like [Paramacrobiotus metropolitanus]XP_055327523.1 mediator of RNA polymerase II transcription subunit 21-like [Paramacrobiotus metropolitanus]